MSAVTIRVLPLVFLLSIAPAGLAQEDSREAERQAELERQEVFRAGFQEIVADLNKNSLERFAMAIDQDDMLERIIGLRLIDQKVQKSFREEFDQNLVGILQSSFAFTEDKNGD